MARTNKTLHEAFARFFENPDRTTFRSLLQEHMGEARNCDFKEAWPEFGAVSRHILGIANAGGGCLVIGVKEDDERALIAEGLATLVDKADINNKLKQYLPHQLLDCIELGDYSFKDSEYQAIKGKQFQLVFVHACNEGIPLVSLRDGVGIRGGAIYVRREGQTVEASHDELQGLLAKRLSSQPQTEVAATDLKGHLDQVRILYGEIPRTLSQPGLFMTTLLASETAQKVAGFFVGESVPNPAFPVEDYQDFVRRMLDGKKAVVAHVLGVGPNLFSYHEQGRRIGKT